MHYLKNIALALGACCSVFAASTQADMAQSNFSYDYAEARIGVAPVTYGAALVKSVHPNAHIRAEIDSEFESDFDSTIAAGFHAPINDWADVYGELGMHATKQRDRYNGDTEFGVELLLGLRQWVSPQIELGAEVGHVSIDDDDHVFGSVAARFHATELFSLGGQMRFNDAYGNQFMFTTRFKF